MGRKPVERVTLQVRFSPEEYADLKWGADLSGRSVPAEVRERMNLAGATGGFDAAISTLVAILSARTYQHLARGKLSETFGPPDEVRARHLSVLRDAFAVALDGLGADPETIMEGKFPVAQGIAWDLAGRIKTPPEKDDTREGRALARIGETLGFRKAKAVKTATKKGSTK